MNELALADDFQFDAQGFLMLRNVFDAERCRRYLEELERLFKSKYDDPWLRDGMRGQTTVQLTEGQRRINGLSLWTEVFDEVISFARRWSACGAGCSIPSSSTLGPLRRRRARLGVGGTGG